MHLAQTGLHLRRLAPAHRLHRPSPSQTAGRPFPSGLLPSTGAGLTFTTPPPSPPPRRPPDPERRRPDLAVPSVSGLQLPPAVSKELLLFVVPPRRRR
ncbi:Os07g0297450 [Oryza sativa Japonica Group]|uniref:Os07g0297450 protein n=1 Tax=Oryza sativa subsp. japonica TaxID=39947 RepID=A0A0P0X4K0_ORYSJ|nr:Os07g0297450 [Oryza sativa Japonica Group]